MMQMIVEALGMHSSAVTHVQIGLQTGFVGLSQADYCKLCKCSFFNTCTADDKTVCISVISGVCKENAVSVMTVFDE